MLPAGGDWGCLNVYTTGFKVNATFVVFRLGLVLELIRMVSLP